MADRLLLRISDAAEALSVSRRTFYNLIATNADIQAAVVHVPGLRGTFIHADRLKLAIDRMSPVAEGGR
jgi:hypothetical protein